jgi:hypothetical protein
VADVVDALEAGAKGLGAIFGQSLVAEAIIRRVQHQPRRMRWLPWSNGQAERMNRTIKDATLKLFHYPNIESLKAHVLAFVAAYNFAKHLKALRWKTPFEAIAHAGTTDPSIFKINPRRLFPGLNN